MKSEKKQVVGGALLSYILIVLNAVYGLLITPYILSRLGTVEYGMYKTVASLSSSLMILDLGLGGTVTRYIAKYKSDNREKDIPNLIAILFLEATIVLLLVTIVCTGVYSQLGNIYKATFTSDQLAHAKNLFLVLSINMLLCIIENVVNGIVTGYNDFLFGNGIKLVRLVCRILLVFIVLQFYPNSMGLVLINLTLTSVFLMIEIYWAFVKHKTRVRFEHWDASLFSESFKYTLLIFSTSIVNQVNGNLDNIVIGAVVSAAAVAVYSMGLTIFGMFQQLSTAISGVLLPSIIGILEEKDGLKKVQKTIVNTGRVQFCLLGAALVGFAVLGKNFIYLWLGDGFQDVYYITLILMIPSIFELCVNACLAVLKAKNLLGFQTVALLSTTVLNAFITYFGTRKFGYFAACFGTAVSWTIGSLILMNLYYYKKFGFPMLKIYQSIIGKTWVALLVPAIVLSIVNRYCPVTWIAFAFECLLFVIIYLVILLKAGLTESELAQIRGRVLKRKEKL